MIHKRFSYYSTKILLVTIVVIGLSMPLKSQALLGVPTTLPFGGYVLFSLPCTCTPGAFWIFYTPGFFGLEVPTPGALVYIPGVSTTYMNFLPGVPTTWELGSYTPGVAVCAVGIPPACAPLPALGLIRQVGTSFPGAIPF